MIRLPLTAVVVCLLLPSSALATVGARDLTFNGAGFVTNSDSGPASGACGVALEPDGDIVVVGIAGPSIFSLIANADAVLVVARFTSAGVLDPSFGSGGIVTTPFGNRVGSGVCGARVVVQPDGMIVAATNVRPASGYGVESIALVRYDANGSLDPLFGTGGIVETPAAVPLEALLRQPSDGKLIVVGTFLTETFGETQFFISRYDTDGSVDTTFGTAGVTTTAIGSAEDTPSSAVLQPDGRIVVAGSTQVGSSDFDFALVRYDDTGALDATFGSGGIVTTALGSFTDRVYDVACQPDGAVVVAGYHQTGSSTLQALARYDGAGALDPTFGTGGIVTLTNLVAHGLVRQADGKLLTGNGGNMTRFTPSGALDTSFGNGGVLTDSLDGVTSLGGLALQPDGRIVVAGLLANSPTFANPRMYVARYLPNCGDGALDPAEECDADGDCCTPACQLVASGESCEDGDLCTAGDVCDGAAQCVPGASPPCNACEACDPGLGCIPSPRPSCKFSAATGAGSVLLKTAPSGDQLKWKWGKGDATTLADFGAVATDEDLTFCIFDGSPAEVLTSATVPAGGTCGTKPCWKANGSSYTYRSKDGAPDGVRVVTLKAGAAGKAKIGLAARAPNLDLPALGGLALPLRVQLIAENGQCWEADYSAAGVQRNDGTTFKAKSD